MITQENNARNFIPKFREANNKIKRYSFPILIIQDLLMKLEGFQWIVALNLNIGYYHIKLSIDDKSI